MSGNKNMIEGTRELGIALQDMCSRSSDNLSTVGSAFAAKRCATRESVEKAIGQIKSKFKSHNGSLPPTQNRVIRRLVELLDGNEDIQSESTSSRYVAVLNTSGILAAAIGRSPEDAANRVNEAIKKSDGAAIGFDMDDFTIAPLRSGYVHTSDGDDQSTLRIVHESADIGEVHIGIINYRGPRRTGHKSAFSMGRTYSEAVATLNKFQDGLGFVGGVKTSSISLTDGYVDLCGKKVAMPQLEAKDEWVPFWSEFADKSGCTLECKKGLSGAVVYNIIDNALNKTIRGTKDRIEVERFLLGDVPKHTDVLSERLDQLRSLYKVALDHGDTSLCEKINSDELDILSLMDAGHVVMPKEEFPIEESGDAESHSSISRSFRQRDPIQKRKGRDLLGSLASKRFKKLTDELPSIGITITGSDHIVFSDLSPDTKNLIVKYVTKISNNQTIPPNAPLIVISPENAEKLAKKSAKVVLILKSNIEGRDKPNWHAARRRIDSLLSQGSNGDDDNVSEDSSIEEAGDPESRSSVSRSFRQREPVQKRKKRDLLGALTTKRFDNLESDLPFVGVTITGSNQIVLSDRNPETKGLIVKYVTKVSNNQTIPLNAPIIIIPADKADMLIKKSVRVISILKSNIENQDKPNWRAARKRIDALLSSKDDNGDQEKTESNNNDASTTLHYDDKRYLLIHDDAVIGYGESSNPRDDGIRLIEAINIDVFEEDNSIPVVHGITETQDSRDLSSKAVEWSAKIKATKSDLDKHRTEFYNRRSNLKETVSKLGGVVSCNGYTISTEDGKFNVTSGADKETPQLSDSKMFDLYSKAKDSYAECMNETSRLEKEFKAISESIDGNCVKGDIVEALSESARVLSENGVFWSVMTPLNGQRNAVVVSDSAKSSMYFNGYKTAYTTDPDGNYYDNLTVEEAGRTKEFIESYSNASTGEEIAEMALLGNEVASTWLSEMAPPATKPRICLMESNIKAFKNSFAADTYKTEHCHARFAIAVASATLDAMTEAAIANMKDGGSIKNAIKDIVASAYAMLPDADTIVPKALAEEIHELESESRGILSETSVVLSPSTIETQISKYSRAMGALSKATGQGVSQEVINYTANSINTVIGLVEQFLRLYRLQQGEGGVNFDELMQNSTIKAWKNLVEEKMRSRTTKDTKQELEFAERALDVFYKYLDGLKMKDKLAMGRIEVLRNGLEKSKLAIGILQGELKGENMISDIEKTVGESKGSRHDYRKISTIARDIRDNWKNVNYAARPYLSAMSELDTLDSNVGADNGRSIINYFLSNSSQWKGAEARKVKAELKAMIASKPVPNSD